MRRHATKQTSTTILWIAVVVLVLAALGNHQRLETCVGECCQHAERVLSCAASPREARSAEAGSEADTGCCCCSGGSSSGGSSSEERAPATGGDIPDVPDRDLGDEVRGTCGPGCCITLALDIEMAPAGAAVGIDEAPLAALLPTCVAATPIAHRKARRLRPFDRGPPRIDRCTALRACTVLQI